MNDVNVNRENEQILNTYQEPCRGLTTLFSPSSSMQLEPITSSSLSLNHLLPFDASSSESFPRRTAIAVGHTPI